MRWTQEQFEAWQARNEILSKEFGAALCDAVDPGPESVLQRKIEAWCKEWGRPCLSFRQSKHAKRMLPAGWPDVTLIMPGEKVLFLELKSASGRLSREQQVLALQFMALGHTVHKIRSYRAFLGLVGGAK